MNRLHWTLGHRLPKFFSNPLFGDRLRFGLKVCEDDHDWQSWQNFCADFYQNTQKTGVGKIVNDAGYRILHLIRLDDKKILEVGPGSLPHHEFWHGKPRDYTVFDTRQDFVHQSLNILEQKRIPATSFLSSDPVLPFDDEVFDIIISFYSLEHMHPLDKYMQEFSRVLRPGGYMVGSIPCEGGLAWGVGRFLTSRRYIKKKTRINPDKIICWEHPNFAEQILKTLERHLKAYRVQFWPLKLPLLDLNLVVRFIYQKKYLSE